MYLLKGENLMMGKTLDKMLDYSFTALGYICIGYTAAVLFSGVSHLAKSIYHICVGG